MNLSHEHPRTVEPPRFELPPVVETALGIQFEELAGFTSAHFGLFFDTVRDRYPIPKDQGRLAPIHESGPPRVVFPEFKFHLMDTKPVERMWFMDSDPGVNLIQIQPDRFGFNWRKPSGEAPYPSYREHGPRCMEEFQSFVSFCANESLGAVKPNLCEVVYVNHIFPPNGSSAIEDFSSVFRGLTWETSTNWLPKPERVSLNRVYTIADNQGRLYAEASIAVHKEKGPMILLKMVGRVMCRGLESVGQDLQLAHDWVVKGFESLTDPLVRKERWGQKL